MINEGNFQEEVLKSGKLFKNFDLAAYINPRPNKDKKTIEILRSSLSYVEEYNNYVKYQMYDIIINDGSLLWFRRTPDEKTQLSFGFLESPYKISYYDFAENFCNESDSESDKIYYYEQYLAEIELRPYVNPLRYDWSPTIYREGVHPASHLHFGFRSEIRFAVDAILTPTQFSILILRHYFTNDWESRAVFNDHDEIERIANSISENGVVPDYRQGKDHLELRLTTTASQQNILLNKKIRKHKK